MARRAPPLNAPPVGAVAGIEEEFLGLVESVRRHDEENAEKRMDRLLAADPEALDLYWHLSQGKNHEEKRLLLRFNNERVARRFAVRKPSRILLLLPFCLQQTKCPHRIVWDTANCRRCGLCAVGELLSLAEKRGADVRVAIRGAFAPKLIREVDPDLTIAVACEDELLLGIFRVPDKACYAILNERPEGPCVNTGVDLERVEGAFKLFA